MTTDEYVKYWVDSSDDDYKASENLYECRNYNWCLFVSHLVIEKLLKGLYVKNGNDGQNVPKIHNLLLLAEKCNLELTEAQLKILKVINTFNIGARYEDYKKDFYNKCTYEYTTEQLKNVREVRKWLKEELKKA